MGRANCVASVPWIALAASEPHVTVQPFAAASASDHVVWYGGHASWLLGGLVHECIEVMFWYLRAREEGWRVFLLVCF